MQMHEGSSLVFTSSSLHPPCRRRRQSRVARGRGGAGRWHVVGSRTCVLLGHLQMGTWQAPSSLASRPPHAKAAGVDSCASSSPGGSSCVRLLDRGSRQLHRTSTDYGGRHGRLFFLPCAVVLTPSSPCTARGFCPERGPARSGPPRQSHDHGYLIRSQTGMMQICASTVQNT